VASCGAGLEVGELRGGDDDVTLGDLGVVVGGRRLGALSSASSRAARMVASSASSAMPSFCRMVVICSSLNATAEPPSVWV
jgi:hypothetical protein